MKHIETDTQIRIANYLHMKYPNLLWTIGLGGIHTTAPQRRKMIQMGYRNGTPDIMIFFPRYTYHGLFIELKAPKGKISPEQREFKTNAELNKYMFSYCWSYEEAIRTIEMYMGVDI